MDEYVDSDSAANKVIVQVIAVCFVGLFVCLFVSLLARLLAYHRGHDSHDGCEGRDHHCDHDACGDGDWWQ